MNKLLALITTLSFVAFSSFATEPSIFVLKNLERERAVLLNTLIQAELPTAERQIKAQALYRRLVSAEQMALRFDLKSGETNELEKQIFTQYDMSFLFHASAEKNINVIEHWLTELDLSNLNIEQGWAGER